MNPKTRIRVGLSLAALVLLAGLVLYGVFDFTTVKRMCLSLKARADAQPILTGLILFSINLLIQAMSVPFKVIASLAAGALMGWAVGGAVTLAGVLCGTTILFAVVRWTGLAVPARFRASGLSSRIIAAFRTSPIRGVAALRMVITLPYPAITIAAATAGLPLAGFIVGSLLGDAPVAYLYAFAGQRLMAMATPGEAISSGWALLLLLAAVVLLGSVAAGRFVLRPRKMAP